MLYPSEGSKYSNLSRRVEIVNSNASILALFIRFLGTLGIGRSKVRARLHIHNPQEEVQEKQFWRRSLGLRGNQFSKSVLKSPGKTRNRKKAPSPRFEIFEFYAECSSEILDRESGRGC